MHRSSKVMDWSQSSYCSPRHCDSTQHGSARWMWLLLLFIIGGAVAMVIGIRNSNDAGLLPRVNRPSYQNAPSRKPIARSETKTRKSVWQDEMSERKPSAVEPPITSNAIMPSAPERRVIDMELVKQHLPKLIRKGLNGTFEPAPLWHLELSHFEVSKPLVALTFDAHYTDQYVDQVLNALREYDVYATFFPTGRWCEKFPEAIAKVANAGHEIGNHTYSHRKLTPLPDEAILDEVERAEQAIKAAIGGDENVIVPFVRPPYGDRDERVVKVLLQGGYIPTYWALDSWDWRSKMTARQVTERVVNKVRAGDIVLLHATSALTAKALPSILDGLKQRGFQPCSLTELIMAVDRGTGEAQH